MKCLSGQSFLLYVLGNNVRTCYIKSDRPQNHIIKSFKPTKIRRILMLTDGPTWYHGKGLCSKIRTGRAALYKTKFD
jgi:hypothetical protein